MRATQYGRNIRQRPTRPQADVVLQYGDENLRLSRIGWQMIPPVIPSLIDARLPAIQCEPHGLSSLELDHTPLVR